MEIRDILFQAGMVGAFIVFTIIMIRIESTERSKRLESFKEFIQQRDELMVDLLEAERNTRRESIAAAIGSVTRLTEAIGKMDERSQEAHAEILVAVKEINGNR